MGQQVYGGNPNADINSEEYKLYDKGVRMGSLGNALLNVIGYFLYHILTLAYFIRWVFRL